MRPILSSILIAALSGLSLLNEVKAETVHDFGCLFSSGADLHDPDAVRALGPVFEHSGRGGRGDFTALRPFFVHEQNARTGKDSWDILWPVGHITSWFNETDWRILLATYHDPDAADPSSAYRFWIFPLLAMGRAKDGEDYGALFPLGGRIDNWFGRDRVEFVLFPLYWHSELNDLRTDHYLWPLIARTTGDDVYRFRVFPFYARSVKKGVEDHRSIMWPFWSSVRYDRPGARGNGFMLFPIYGHSKTECSETWMFLPPLFRHSTGKKSTENIYLWPIIQSKKSKDEDKFYVWPLYGRRTTKDETRRYWLWPFIWNRVETRIDGEVHRTRVFPVYDSENILARTAEKQVIDRYVSIWPLGSYTRIHDDYKRFRFLDLWPFRDSPGVERNLTPWWTLYKYERTPAGRENDILWGLIHWGAATNGASYHSVFPLVSWGRDDQVGKTKNWEFLKGMLGYSRDEAGTKWRALYFINWRNKP